MIHASSTSTPTTHDPQEQTCSTTGLHYLAAGSGSQAVVFVHGWMAFKEIWWSALRATAATARVYAPDLPGHGGSVGCPATSMGQIAETIATFCMARGLNRIMLVGHSMGGNIAAELTLRHPDLIERLVLVNPAIQARDMPIYTRSYLHSHQGWLALRASIALAQQVSRFGAHVPHEHGGGLIMPTLRRFRYMAQHDPEVVHRLLGAMFANPLLERLPNITQPTLLIAGQHDPLVPLALSRRVAQAIPGARLAVIPNGAHNPMDEHPAIFSALFLPFLGLR